MSRKNKAQKIMDSIPFSDFPPGVKMRDIETPNAGLHAVARPTATSEQLYGISEQPKPTCPMIDSVIADLRKCDQIGRAHV